MIDPSDRLELWLHYATGTKYRQFSAAREEYYYLEEAFEDVQKGRMERPVAGQTAGSPAVPCPVRITMRITRSTKTVWECCVPWRMNSTTPWRMPIRGHCPGR